MAGGKGSVYCNDLLKMLFNAVGIPNICDNAAASPLTVPGPRPSKASSEIALSRAEMSAAVISGPVCGWPG